ncbi:hypothetical protein U9M48_007466 [Paspalum notatum var. saurae]|uniref:Uncharacterized protein n=1 Tax=Paspalum notatum var. saurae TaxID=547442 RepID=A0AAQ3PUD9_PASNO
MGLLQLQRRRARHRTALLRAVTVLVRRRSSTTRNKYRLPPGPRPWQVIGNLNLIGSLPHRSIHALSARYGPLMSLRFGSVPVVVGSSVDAARFFLRTNDAAFIDRPKMASGRYTAYNFSDIVWAPYGAYWRQARKLWQMHLFSERQLRSQEHVRREEVRVLLRDLHGLSSSSSSSTVALKEHLLMLSLNVISRMALGRKYVGEGTVGSPVSPAEFRWMVDELFLLNGVFSLGDFIPWLSWMDLQGYVGRMKRLGKMFDAFLEHVVDEHKERRRREGDRFVATDMVDLLLELADDPNLEVPIARDGVKGFTLLQPCHRVRSRLTRCRLPPLHCRARRRRAHAAARRRCIVALAVAARRRRARAAARRRCIVALAVAAHALLPARRRRAPDPPSPRTRCRPPSRSPSPCTRCRPLPPCAAAAAAHCRCAVAARCRRPTGVAARRRRALPPAAARHRRALPPARRRRAPDPPSPCAAAHCCACKRERRI